MHYPAIKKRKGNSTVILKGFNAMIVYWDIHGDKNFPEIEKTGANCVRIFWNLASPRPQPSDLDQVLGNCIAHHMIPVISLWEATIFISCAFTLA